MWHSAGGVDFYTRQHAVDITGVTWVPSENGVSDYLLECEQRKWNDGA